MLIVIARVVGRTWVDGIWSNFLTTILHLPCLLCYELPRLFHIAAEPQVVRSWLITWRMSSNRIGNNILKPSPIWSETQVVVFFVAKIKLGHCRSWTDEYWIRLFMPANQLLQILNNPYSTIISNGKEKNPIGKKKCLNLSKNLVHLNLNQPELVNLHKTYIFLLQAFIIKYCMCV